MNTDDLPEVPFKPRNGRILLMSLGYKPSTIIEVPNIDFAFENESVVLATDDVKYARKPKMLKGRIVGYELTGEVLPMDFKRGQRVIHKGTYQSDDTITLTSKTGRVKCRVIDPWDVVGVIEADRPDGYVNPITEEKTQDGHPLLIKA